MTSEPIFDCLGRVTRLIPDIASGRQYGFIEIIEPKLKDSAYFTPAVVVGSSEYGNPNGLIEKTGLSAGDIVRLDIELGNPQSKSKYKATRVVFQYSPKDGAYGEEPEVGTIRAVKNDFGFVTFGPKHAVKVAYFPKDAVVLPKNCKKTFANYLHVHEKVLIRIDKSFIPGKTADYTVLKLWKERDYPIEPKRSGPKLATPSTSSNSASKQQSNQSQSNGNVSSVASSVASSAPATSSTATVTEANTSNHVNNDEEQQPLSSNADIFTPQDFNIWDLFPQENRAKLQPCRWIRRHESLTAAVVTVNPRSLFCSVRLDHHSTPIELEVVECFHFASFVPFPLNKHLGEQDKNIFLNIWEACIDEQRCIHQVSLAWFGNKPVGIPEMDRDRFLELYLLNRDVPDYEPPKASSVFANPLLNPFESSNASPLAAILNEQKPQPTVSSRFSTSSSSASTPPGSSLPLFGPIGSTARLSPYPSASSSLAPGSAIGSNVPSSMGNGYIGSGAIAPPQQQSSTLGGGGFGLGLQSQQPHPSNNDLLNNQFGSFGNASGHSGLLMNNDSLLAREMSDKFRIGAGVGNSAGNSLNRFASANPGIGLSGSFNNRPLNFNLPVTQQSDIFKNNNNPRSYYGTGLNSNHHQDSSMLMPHNNSSSSSFNKTYDPLGLSHASLANNGSNTGSLLSNGPHSNLLHQQNASRASAASLYNGAGGFSNGHQLGHAMMDQNRVVTRRLEAFNNLTSTPTIGPSSISSLSGECSEMPVID